MTMSGPGLGDLSTFWQWDKCVWETVGGGGGGGGGGGCIIESVHFTFEVASVSEAWLGSLSFSRVWYYQ